MFKNISRSLQKKVDCKIVFEITKISAQFEEPCKVQVVWKRGPEEQEGELIEMGPDATEVECKDRFVKVSSFYSKDERITHEPKTCEIILQTVSEEDEIKSVFARIPAYNMGPFVKITKTEIPATIKFPDSLHKDTFIEVKWTIFADEGLVKQTSSVDGPSEVYTQTEINEFIK
jgi:hypothetical protein